MYPELFRIPYIDYSISTFGVMMATGFLVGFWITLRRMAEEGLEPELGSTLLIYVMLGGVLGSKLYFAIDNWLLGAGSLSSLFFARAGITWYGGLLGGTVSTLIGCRIHGVSARRFAECIAVPLAVGQALGRVGCFLVGDDYGRATDRPWGVAFTEGSPPTAVLPDGSLERVHPTQIYEVLWLVPVAALLWSRRRKSPFLLGEYLALNGAGRVVIEHWRVNPRVALGLTEPQWIGIGLVVFGLAGWLYYWRKRSAGAP